MLKLFNSMGRRLEPFDPIVSGEVRMYTCGPTVWNYAHIGNLRTFVFEDVLRRYLKFKGYRVDQVMNITDVEDKIIKGIKQFNKPLRELTTFYETAFKKDLATLRVEKAEKYPRATEHVPEMVSLIETLMRGGYAYRAPDGSVYFDISKFKAYGALSGVKIDKQKSTGRVASDHYEEKQEAFDFALWKAWDPDDGDVFWETTLGKGRPGWSIECSAMSMKYLGESFDIHTGGLDNKFPHHENEIAQSEAATGEKFVRFWLHSGILTTNLEAMHKSVGNVVYLADLVKQGWEPNAIRLFLISARYRDSLDLTQSQLVQARALCKRLQDLIARLRGVEGAGGSGSPSHELLTRFEEAMDDDLNTPAAFGALSEFVRKANALIDSDKLGRKEADEALDALGRVDSVFQVMNLQENALPEPIARMIEEREGARRMKDFAKSDRIRDQLLAEGYVLEDSPKGTVWKRKQG